MATMHCSSTRMTGLLLLVFVWLVPQTTLAKVPKEDKKSFDALVKAVRQAGGYVHPSLGLISPAPSGASRGIGIVKPGKPTIEEGNDVVIKVPYGYQMTRPLALATLTEIIPPSVLIDAPLNELDDAALLVLLLVHEYGRGKQSKFYAYLQSLPSNGDCGWAQDVEDARNLPVGVDLDDIDEAIEYAYRVSNGMAGDYGEYLAQTGWPKEWKKDTGAALQWALCMVSSRGTAANSVVTAGGDPTNSQTSTGVRLVPLVDMANHHKSSFGFTELSGSERLVREDFMDATPEDAGAFVVRSCWKCGTTRVLEPGDEITVNYNLPAYGPVDWFLSLGFVPPEVYLNGGNAENNKRKVEL